MADYLGATGAFTLLHQGVGWIWDGRLLAKAVKHPDDCHYSLFGNDAFRVRFRGWFNPKNGLLCIQDRKRETRSADDIPEWLYQHLHRRFKMTATKIRVY